jgi:nucleotide-binding universal stress UspA family protein
VKDKFTKVEHATAMETATSVPQPGEIQTRDLARAVLHRSLAMSRRILAPLALPTSRDEKALSESILPDACCLAGPGGTLVLVCDIASPLFTGENEVNDYLLKVAAQQCQTDRKVEVHLLRNSDIPRALDEAVKRYQADMIACATHGAGPFRRLVRGGVVWRVLSRSDIPILIRHGEVRTEKAGVEPASRRILVPLDGSPLAEMVLPLVEELAAEWHASTHLTQVVRQTAHADEVAAAHAYLQETAGRLSGQIHATVLIGEVVDSLIKAVDNWKISEVVMTSHGRTGLARVILGSVADGLVPQLHCPIIVLPLTAVLASGQGPGLERHKDLFPRRLHRRDRSRSAA